MKHTAVNNSNFYIKPVTLTCDNNDFIERLIKIFTSSPAVIQSKKNAQRKATAISNKMGIALSDCIQQKSVTPFIHFLEHLFQQLTAKKRFEVLQECYRHLNSSDVVFSGKHQSWWNDLNVQLGLRPATLLSRLNELIDNELKKTKSKIDQSQQSISRNSRSGCFRELFFMMLFCAVKTAVSSPNANQCAIDQSPRNYFWQRQCHITPPQNILMDPKHSKKLYEKCLVFSNYPIEYAQVLVWGYFHGNTAETPVEVEPDPRSKKVNRLMVHASKPTKREYVLVEGASFDKNFSCKKAHLHLDKKSKTVCRGWEFMSEFKKSRSLLKKANTVLKEFNKFSAERETIVAKPFSPERTKELNKIDKTLELLTNLFNEVNQELGLTMKDRNKGLIHSIKSIFAKDPNTRIFVKGGSAHFFVQQSMIKYQATDVIAELRNFFENLDAEGKPIALMFMRDDENAEVFRRNGCG